MICKKNLRYLHHSNSITISIKCETDISLLLNSRRNCSNFFFAGIWMVIGKFPSGSLLIEISKPWDLKMVSATSPAAPFPASRTILIFLLSLNFVNFFLIQEIDLSFHNFLCMTIQFVFQHRIVILNQLHRH